MRQKPWPKGSDRTAILPQALTRISVSEASAGGDRAGERGVDVVDNHVDMHGRPVSIVAPAIGRRRQSSRPAFAKGRAGPAGR